MPTYSSNSTQSKKFGDRSGAATLPAEKHVPGDKTKNVSHVPCKFFKQSICQAGDKCPFSHDLEAESQTICKYFQRGNCKFGSKCALAHITPDGKQMNKKPSKPSKKKEKPKEDKAKESALRSPGTKSAGPKSPANGLAPLSSSGSSPGKPLSASRIKPSKDIANNSKLRTGSGNDQVLVELATQILSKYNVGSPHSAHNSLPYSKTTMRSLSATLPFQPSSSGWHGTRPGDDFAIADDDEEDEDMDNMMRYFSKQRQMSWINSQGNDSGLQTNPKVKDGGDNDEDKDEEEEEGYTEQLVPSALQDLLTPLERERRNSRNSQQKSGRVFSSPALTSPVSLGIRRGSSSSEPNGDLWGPRNSVTPFNRNTHFGSPPPGSSQLVSSSSSALSSPIIGHAEGTAGFGLHTAKPQPLHTQKGVSSSSTPLMSQTGASAWGLSNIVISENEEQSIYDQPSQVKGMYQPFQQYQQSAFVPTEKI